MDRSNSRQLCLAEVQAEIERIFDLARTLQVILEVRDFVIKPNEKRDG